jgi:uncharacterized radical SAM superfamily Fe-S cluster-containing enzyme
LVENNPDEIVKEISQMTANSNELATCLPAGGMQYSYNHFFEIKKKLLEKQKKGQHRGIRYVTIIDNENIHLIKIYLQAGIQVRHVRNLPWGFRQTNSCNNRENGRWKKRPKSPSKQ